MSLRLGVRTTYHEVRNLEVVTTSQPVTNYLWDNGSGDSLWTTAENWESDVLPPDEYDVLFDNTYSSTAQSIDLDGGKIVRSVSFDSGNPYTLNNDTLIFENDDQPGAMSINVSQVNGSADHTFNSNIEISADTDPSFTTLFINNQGQDRLLLNGDVELNANNLAVTAGMPGSIDFAGAITGIGGLSKSGAGTMLLSNRGSTFTGGAFLNNGQTVIDPGSNHVSFGENSDRRSFLGSGAVTVDGGDLEETTSTNRDIRFFGDFSVNAGSTATLSAGDDVELHDGANIDVNGGILNLTSQNDDFAVRNSGTTRFTVRNGGTATIDVPSRFSLDVNSTTTVDGATSNFTVTSTRNIFAGEINLIDHGTIDSDTLDTRLIDATIVGGDSVTAGELIARGTLRVDNVSLTNRPDITVAPAVDAWILGLGGGQSLTGVGTLTIDASDPNATIELDGTIVNLEAQTLDLVSGTLLFDNSDRIADTTKIYLSGGGINTDRQDEALGCLTLTASSAIDLGSGNGGSVLSFADSTGQSWNGASLLTIANWSGLITGGGDDQVVFDGAGLTVLKRNKLSQRRKGTKDD